MNSGKIDRGVEVGEGEGKVYVRLVWREDRKKFVSVLGRDETWKVKERTGNKDVPSTYRLKEQIKSRIVYNSKSVYGDGFCHDGDSTT